jgi:hypothetical protein
LRTAQTEISMHLMARNCERQPGTGNWREL